MRRCDANEHFYDENKHSSCPYCTGTRNDTVKTVMHDKKTDLYRSGTDTLLVKDDEKKATSEDLSISSRNKEPSLDTNDAPKTVGVWGRKKEKTNTEETHTDTNNDLKYDEAPVVGWLVIIEGKNKGMDFKIIPGINIMGRGDTNSIDISTGDSEISREKHCIIEFDYKNSEFYLERGASTTYLNNNRVGGDGKELNLGDIVEIGNTKLRFIPFCSEQFCWEL